MATAQILFQRFFYCKSFVRHCAEVRHVLSKRLSPSCMTPWLMSVHVSRDADGGYSMSSPRVEDRGGAAASEGCAERVPSPQTQHRKQVTVRVCVTSCDYLWLFWLDGCLRQVCESAAAGRHLHQPQESCDQSREACPEGARLLCPCQTPS